MFCFPVWVGFRWVFVLYACVLGYVFVALLVFICCLLCLISWFALMVLLLLLFWEVMIWRVWCDDFAGFGVWLVFTYTHFGYCYLAVCFVFNCFVYCVLLVIYLLYNAFRFCLIGWFICRLLRLVGFDTLFVVGFRCFLGAECYSFCFYVLILLCLYHFICVCVAFITLDLCLFDLGYLNCFMFVTIWFTCDLFGVICCLLRMPTCYCLLFVLIGGVLYCRLLLICSLIVW